MPTAPRRHRRWYRPRLGVRGLMVLVLIVGGGVGTWVHLGRVQRDAVAAISRTGGDVDYGWRWPLRGWLDPRQGSGPVQRLAHWLGDDYFGFIVHVCLGDETTDAELAHVGRLSRLVGLGSFFPRRVTDAGVAHLAGLTDLE